MIDEPVAPATPLPNRRERLALRVLQLGLIAIILAVSTYKTFELDRYFVPKELTLHLTALICGGLTLRTFRQSFFTRVDLLLIAYLLLSAISSVFATNYWMAMRALCISASGIGIFWSARALRQAGLGRPLLITLATAAVLIAITSLLQTYGVRTDMFSLNRAPGGTLGNRNFIAHAAAFSAPLVIVAALQARHRLTLLTSSIGVALVVAVLVLTRSRAGWLAFVAGVLVLIAAMLLARPLRIHKRLWLRMVGLGLLTGVGVAAAVFVPNSLRWKAEKHPYLQSMKSVTNYQEGSGHGRLIQYRRSLRMASAHALLGVGPGNWSVKYPKHAAPNDPSLNHNAAGTTANPWPSSDWVAQVSERGFLTTFLLLAALAVMAWQSLLRLMRTSDADEALPCATLLALLAAAMVAGAFDAVLILALPTLIVWTALGVLWTPESTSMRPTRASALTVVTLIAGLGAMRSVAQLGGMYAYVTFENTHALRIGSLIDPGNYRLHMKLAGARRLKASVRCRHARAAHELFPYAAAAKQAQRNCK